MRLLEAVVTLAVAAACVTAQTSPTCLDEYMCSFEVADSTGATYSFDFRQLCEMGALWLDRRPPCLGGFGGLKAAQSAGLRLLFHVFSKVL